MESIGPQVVRQSAPLRQQVRDLLRSAIVEMRFAPGERLIERELCDMAGVSRTVIREVLRELESSGLITNIPNKGPVVAGPMGYAEACGIYEIRAVLEAQAGRNFACYADDTERGALRIAFERIRDAYNQESDPKIVLRAKAEFYAVLLAGARNAAVASVLRGMFDRITALRAMTIASPNRAKRSIREMRLIVKAVDARDPDGAWNACIRHVQSAAAIALDILRRQETGQAAEQRDVFLPLFPESAPLGGAARTTKSSRGS